MNIKIDFEKAKQGAGYTAGKVKILRPVTLANGNTFQRNYWVDLSEVKPTDTVVNDEEGSDNKKTNMKIKISPATTKDNVLKDSTSFVSAVENGKKFLNDILEKNGLTINDSDPTFDIYDTIQKIATLNDESKSKKLDEEQLTRINVLKDELEKPIKDIFQSMKNMEMADHYARMELLELNNIDNIKSLPSNIQAFLPTWLEKYFVETRNSNYTENTEYNFTTKKLIIKKDSEIENLSPYYEAVGYKIEQENKNIQNIVNTYLKDMIDRNNKQLESIADIYPMLGYSIDDKTVNNTNTVDPVILKPAKDKVSNVMAKGLSLFMNSSAWKKVLMIDIEYAQMIYGILISKKG